MLAVAPVYAQAPAAPRPSASFHPLDAVDDETLVRLVDAALRTHPEVLAAEAELTREEALARAASRPLFNPELELELESSDTDDKILRFTQTLDLAGRRTARARVADGHVGASAQRLALTRRDLAVEVLSALGAYWTARDAADLADQRLDLLDRVAQVAEQRARIGDATQADLNLAGLARVQARMERAGAAADLAAAEQALAALVPSGSGADWPPLPTALPDVDGTAPASTS